MLELKWASICIVMVFVISFVLVVLKVPQPIGGILSFVLGYINGTICMKCYLKERGWMC